jgi:hypothetical protein
MKKIEEYKNLILNEYTEPKPKNWYRKTFDCGCNIPIVSADTDLVTDLDSESLERININYRIKPIDEMSVMVGGSNQRNWWMSGKSNYWEITHLDLPDFKNIKYHIHVGFIKRGGGITPSPLYIVVEDVEKYKTLMLVKARSEKIKKLMDV